MKAKKRPIVNLSYSLSSKSLSYSSLRYYKEVRKDIASAIKKKFPKIKDRIFGKTVLIEFEMNNTLYRYSVMFMF